MTERQYDIIDNIRTVINVIERLGVSKSNETKLPIQIIDELRIKSEDKKLLKENIQVILNILKSNE